VTEQGLCVKLSCGDGVFDDACGRTDEVAQGRANERRVKELLVVRQTQVVMSIVREEEITRWVLLQRATW
jgi:hypothetical protein